MQGIVPVACILFALAVGVATSALIRRTIPAMAVTLLAYAVTRIPIHWIRWHFAPLTSRTLTVPLGTLLYNVTGSPRDLATSAVPPDAWLHSLTVIDPSGQPVSTDQGNFNVLQEYCPNLQVNPTRDGVLNPGTCAARIHNLSFHATISYQPASHFWAIQAIESAIFIGLAALLVTTAVIAVNRRRPA